MTQNETLAAILGATRDDGLTLDDGSYLDWSSAGNLEVGDAQGKVVQLTVTREDLRQLVHQLAATLLTTE